MYTTEWAFITKGSRLVAFDDARQRAAVAAATGQVNGARAALVDLRAGTRPQDLARAKALAQHDYAQLELARSATPYQSWHGANSVRRSRKNTTPLFLAFRTHGRLRASFTSHVRGRGLESPHLHISQTRIA